MTLSANSTPHTDARVGSMLCRRSMARAGERGSYTAEKVYGWLKNI